MLWTTKEHLNLPEARVLYPSPRANRKIEDYIMSLKNNTYNCEFAQLIDELTKGRVVCGTNNGTVRARQDPWICRVLQFCLPAVCDLPVSTVLSAWLVSTMLNLQGTYDDFPQFWALNTGAWLKISVNRWQIVKKRRSCVRVWTVEVTLHVSDRSVHKPWAWTDITPWQSFFFLFFSCDRQNCIWKSDGWWLTESSKCTVQMKLIILTFWMNMKMFQLI